MDCERSRLERGVEKGVVKSRRDFFFSYLQARLVKVNEVVKIGVETE